MDVAETGRWRVGLHLGSMHESNIVKSDFFGEPKVLIDLV